MNERLKFKGRLAEKELELERLKLKITGLVKSIRDTLDPFEAIEDLKTDEAAQQAVELAQARILWCEVSAEIKAIKKALG